MTRPEDMLPGHVYRDVGDEHSVRVVRHHTSWFVETTRLNAGLDPTATSWRTCFDAESVWFELRDAGVECEVQQATGLAGESLKLAVAQAEAAIAAFRV